MPQAEVLTALEESLNLGLVSIWSADLRSPIEDVRLGSDRASIRTNGLGIVHAVDYTVSHRAAASGALRPGPGERPLPSKRQKALPLHLHGDC